MEGCWEGRGRGGVGEVGQNWGSEMEGGGRGGEESIQLGYHSGGGG